MAPSARQISIAAWPNTLIRGRASFMTLSSSIFLLRASVGFDVGRLDDAGPAVDLATHEIVRLSDVVAHRVESELGKFRADRRCLDAIEKCAVQALDDRDRRRRRNRKPDPE